ncbi:OpgC family protein [Geminicoccus roseus]|uniref:OpgC family protein n=1 Tax=Geminicoccus roseus TaxID=404900 RepID=UPI000422FD7E|nr:OpgC domain-containing protein [Geminicoccus roseus]
MSAGSEPRRSERDLRLDFFRGIGMFIILIAHIPGNAWINWIPARFGFSDATEIFVFCSGMASAYAFARVFDRHGQAIGTARIGLRVWQIWWAQIGVFVAVLAAMIVADRMFATDSYTRTLQFDRFFADPASGILGLVTLTYVPNYFDILPMYLVILGMIPLVMAVERLAGGRVVLVLLGLLWLAAQARITALPADPWSERVWYFDPAGWQLVFFTGFGFVRGWLPAPPRSKTLVVLALLLVLVSIPFTWLPMVRSLPFLQASHEELRPLFAKTPFGLLRHLHFLALAYLAWLAVGPAGQRLKGVLVEQVVAVGRQTLAVFLSGIVLARILGVVLDQLGPGWLVTLLVNLAGMAALLAVARVVQWYKDTPWTRRTPRPSPPAAMGAEGRPPDATVGKAAPRVSCAAS